MPSNLEPASTFCCGCSLKVGLATIMSFHLLACFLYISLAFFNIVLHVSTVGATWGPVMQMWISGLYFAGIPMICSGLYGVLKRIEVHVWIYFMYLAVCFAFDTIALVHVFMWQDACTTNKSIITILGQDFGEAFVCGLTRLASWIFVLAAITFEVYCLFIVWSFCEDLRINTPGPSLWELIPSKAEAFKKKHGLQNSNLLSQDDVVGIAHAKLAGPYPFPYGSVQDLADPTYTIFGGSEHEMNFPLATAGDKNC